MLTKQQQAQVIADLDTQFDVQDVYFAKGTLFVVNAYDIPAVEDYLETTNFTVRYQYVEDDVFAF